MKKRAKFTTKLRDGKISYANDKTQQIVLQQPPHNKTTVNEANHYFRDSHSWLIRVYFYTAINPTPVNQTNRVIKPERLGSKVALLMVSIIEDDLRHIAVIMFRITKDNLLQTTLSMVLAILCMLRDNFHRGNGRKRPAIASA